MLDSELVIESELNSSSARENVSPDFCTTMRSTSSCGRIVSPLTLISEILYWSPSVTPAVMNMSRLSGLIETWVESMLKST
ncbi:hypothetical protein D3C72_1252970 [compost metagenome]